ncbi:MAG TPA: hypothetical protein VFS59_09755 [Gemmatimonadaceae bacterium]|nr:hypothetical protein [Gemmatimonadaceae bacterium]
MTSRLLALAGVSALGASLVACAADSTGPNASAAGFVSLSFASVGASSTSSSTSVSGGTLSGAVAGSSSVDALVITRVQLVLAELELQRAGGTCTSGDASSSSDSCEELELAPTMIELPVNGNVVSAVSVPVPPGSYSAFEAKITLADTGRRGGAALIAAHPELRAASVRVEGTFNGKPFTYTGATRAQIESRFDPPLVADASGINVTVRVNLTGWFRTSSGAIIDPATANAGGPNAELVSTNIARSFVAFCDDDRDGRDDRGE